MASGIYSALSGAIANEARVDVLSHNLANVNTVGFQGFKMALETAKGAVENEELTFAGPTEITTDTSSGPIVATDNPLDISLANGVYLGVEDGGRQGYVRGATLIPLDDGRLVTSQGHMVVNDNNEKMTVPPGAREVLVMGDGTVTADGAEVGKLKLVEFADEQGLIQEAGRFMVDDGNANPQQSTSEQPIIPGYLEMSNVSAVKSMTDLISAQHSYSATLRVIETFNQMEKRAASSLIG